MTSYIVEVDSSFRDINKYQSQTNFSIPFQTPTEVNNTTQLLGSPYYSKLGYNNFFNSCSIDPNFNNANLSVVNGNVQEITQDESDFYISGIAFDTSTFVTSSTGFGIYYKTQKIFSINDIRNTSPYLIKLTRLVDDSYIFQWCIYAVGTVLGSLYPTYPTNFICKHRSTKRKGIFWYWDFNYYSFDVYSVKNNFSPQLFFSITNDMIPNVSINNRSNFISAFDLNGNDYIVNNRAWGYHIIQSNFSMGSINFDNNYIQVVNDAADNLYIGTNLNGTNLQYSSLIVPNAPLFCFTDMISTTYTYRYLNGSTGSYTGAGIYTEFFYYTSNDCVSGRQLFSTIYVAKGLPTELNNFNVRQLPLILTKNWSPQVYFSNIQNNLYVIGYIGDNVQPSNFNPSNKYAGLIYLINPIANTSTLVAQTPPLFNSCNMIGSTIGTMIYFPGRDNFQTIYMYAFNSLTNTIVSNTSISITSTSSLFCFISSFILSSNTLIVVSPDCNILNSSNILLRSQPLHILTYTISTNTLTEVNTSLFVYPSLINVQKWLLYKNNRILYFISYNVPSIIDIFDLTNPLSPYLIISLNIKLINFNPYSSVDSYGNIHYYLAVSESKNGNSLFCLDDLTNIYNIYDNICFNQEFKNYRVIPTTNPTSSCNISSFGYSFAPSETYEFTLNGTINRFRWIDYPSVEIYSTHFYHNNSNQISLSNNFNMMESLTINGVNYLFIATNSLIQVWKCSDILYPEILTSYTFSLPLSSELLFFKILYDSSTSLVYFLLGNLSQVLVLQANSTFSQWLSLSLITPGGSGSDIRGATIYNTAQYGIYFIVSQQEGLLRKYSIQDNLVTFIVSNVYSPFYSQTLFITESYYNTSTNEYNLFLGTQSVPSNSTLPGRYSYLNINSPTSLYLITGADSLVIPNDLTTPSNIWYNVTNVAGRSVNIPMMYIDTGIETSSATIFGLGYLYNYGSSIKNVNKNYNFITGTGYVTNQSVQWFDKLENKSYLAINTNSSVGSNDRITITDVSNASNILSEEGTLNILVPGNVLQLSTVTINIQTTLVALIKNLAGTTYSLWLYDVSNVENAVKYQTLTPVTTTYSNIKSICGAGIVHKIDTFGVPLWLNVIGGSIDYTTNSSRQVSLNGIDIDSKSSLYISGNWSRKIDFYYGVGTGSSYNIYNYPSNQFLNTINNSLQGFVSRCRITDGLWNWVTPIIGSSKNIFKNIVYSNESENLYTTFYFNSINLNLFLPQTSVSSPSGPFVFQELIPQAYFFNSSTTNSVIMCIDNNGIFIWRTILFSNNDVNSKINVSNLYLDEQNSSSRLFICGITNSTDMIGLDPFDSLIQALYPKIDSVNQEAGFLYQFSLTGGYINSSYQVTPSNTISYNNIVRSFSTLNLIFTINQTSPFLSSQYISIYNQDSTLAQNINLVSLTVNNIFTEYYYNPIFTDSNGYNYTTVLLYNFSGPSNQLTETYYRSQLFILGDSNDVTLNKNFTVRYGTFNSINQTMKLILNQYISNNNIIRTFSTVNDLTGTNNYFNSNFSPSPLYDIGYYSTSSITGNNISLTTLYNHSPGSVDLAKQYYITFPQNNTGSTGFYDSIISIDQITYNTTTNKYTLTIPNIDLLRSPSPSGSYYGPYLYICEKNYSAFYTLQWYPGSRVYPQTYLVGLYDLIIPNRPIQNSRYEGFQTISKYPYIYLVIYNSDDAENYDPTVVNSVYDNNIYSPRFAIFQIPTTTFVTFNNSDYMSASSSSTPKIRFVPGYYNISFRLTDDRGNTLLFDSSPYRITDNNIVVSDSLLNITIRLAFKKS
jgi:hypothetical protein